MREAGMDRPDLQHPLPEEIQKMQRDETICKFCGVSYLIHNEIKALEDKLRAAEEELVFYRGIEGREEKLKQQITELQAKIDKLQQELVGKDAILGTLRSDVTSRDCDIEKMKQEKLDADKHLTDLSHRCEQLRLKHGLYSKNLPSLMKQLQEHRAESNSIRNLVTAQNTVLREDCRLIQDNISTVIQDKLADVTRLQDQLTQLENATAGQKLHENELQTQLDQAQLQIQQLQPAAQLNKQLEDEVSQLKEQLKNSSNKLEEMTRKARSLSMENDQYNDRVKKSGQELESLNNKNRQLMQNAEMNETKLSKLQRDVNEREKDLDTMRHQMLNMRQEYEEQNEKLTRISSMSSSQTEDLKEAVDKLSRDMTALKNEREMMITAHQNQIEQLRESFKSRILDADKWPQRMEEALRKERERHAAAMTSLEEKLKENFVMELQIEKQKHQELLHKYHNDTRVDERQVKVQLDTLHNQYKSELSELHKQLAEYKARARVTENGLRDEITSLKKIIKDLQDRLARVDTTAESQVLELKSQLHSTRSELDDVRRDFTKQQQLYATAKEEIFFLQETVRKECEERFELTEALSQAKEDLLAYKKPPGGYGPQQAWASSRGSSASSSAKTEPANHNTAPASTSTINSTRSEEIAIYKKLATNRPQPPSQPRESVSEKTERDNVNTNTLALDTQKSTKGDTGRGLKGASLTESRRRISNMLGRR